MLLYTLSIEGMVLQWVLTLNTHLQLSPYK